MALTTGSNLIRFYLRSMSCAQVKTAGILVIGDELLKGEVIDTNSPHITKELHELGVKVKKISVIGDDVDEICNEVRLFSKSYNYVITTGGIGPTHDDVTFEAVAKAFGVPLILNGQLRPLCERFYNTKDLNHPGMKLARVPETAKLLFADECNYPTVFVENVYLFPGIPELFLRAFQGNAPKLFKCDGVTFYSRVVFVTLTEDQIADALTNLASKHADVQIGSYPKLNNKDYKVKITIESINEKSADEVCQKLLSKFPKETVVGVDNDFV